MKINWKVRIKSKEFWITVIPTTVACAYFILKALGIEMNFGEGELVSFLLALVEGFAIVGILNDPTTAGLGDSELALTYEQPKDDHEEYPNAEE